MEKPNYQKIYQHIIQKKFPEKEVQTKSLLKEDMTSLDVIKISKILNSNFDNYNQKHKSYDLDSILKILEFQKSHNLTNILVAEKFKISRNSIAKWKKIYG
ncbi:helix-turn-helix domain-containing protein [Empedobacter sedimenti]|uniref:helix-turn-helix domain-containing protein n=1 Tax=Empedobacter sedimenti TaxID=3042610 RepID=UPI0024A6AA19|nr:helix-turn-helix domain-containing protein [Empedobacter sedimenti]